MWGLIPAHRLQNTNWCVFVIVFVILIASPIFLRSKQRSGWDQNTVYCKYMCGLDSLWQFIYGSNTQQGIFQHFIIVVVYIVIAKIHHINLYHFKAMSSNPFNCKILVSVLFPAPEVDLTINMESAALNTEQASRLLQHVYSIYSQINTRIRTRDGKLTRWCSWPQSGLIVV